MSAESGFVDSKQSGKAAKQGMVTFKPSLTPSTRGSKRKRGNHDQASTDLRESKRSTAGNAYAQAQNSTGAGAPTASMTNPQSENMFAQQQSSSTGDEQSSQHFDLGAALQAHSQSASAQSAGGVASSNMDTAAAALSQHYSMQVPPHPADTFMNEPTVGTADTPYTNLDNAHEYHGPDGVEDPAGDNGSGKPSVGSDEWHKQRKENHKEVERRRRETINEGINELAKIVPNCEKNKGSILARTVQYITKLHEDATQNIDKWTFEKLVTEQALADLSGKLQRAWAEKEAWKRVAKEGGVDVDTVDLGLEVEQGADEGEAGNGVDQNTEDQGDDEAQGQGRNDAEVEV